MQEVKTRQMVKQARCFLPYFKLVELDRSVPRLTWECLPPSRQKVTIENTTGYILIDTQNGRGFPVLKEDGHLFIIMWDYWLQTEHKEAEEWLIKHGLLDKDKEASVE